MSIMQMKKKRKAPDSDGDDDAITRSLAAYGERFMQMFEDADQHAAAQAQRASQAAEDESDPSAAESDSDSDASGSYTSSGSEAHANGGSAAAEEFIFDSLRVLPKQQQQQQRPKVKQRSGAPQQAPQQPSADAKAERKAFMSSKAAKVHAGAAPGAAARQAAAAGASGEEEGLTREEFLKMQREVELYGAQALDKRSRKRFEAAMLSKLGAKAAKSPRIPAKIGLGMAKKAAQREAAAVEAAIDAGMLKRKGLGKKKREEKRQSLDRGLMEDRGAFKGGVLKLKPPRGPKSSSAPGRRKGGR